MRLMNGPGSCQASIESKLATGPARTDRRPCRVCFGQRAPPLRLLAAIRSAIPFVSVCDAGFMRQVGRKSDD
jgi:hypothetical protein